MRVILSRKCFDSANGKVPSPILPDGSLVPIPILLEANAVRTLTRPSGKDGEDTSMIA
ncbi:MAG: hypothetical protein NTY19_06350 [Planctomycetota bacterium]|nr:hypothetical protein [Planctomycetota bacterium]